MLVQYDDKTALIVVDVQNDFADSRGSLYVAQGEDVVPVANREIDRARAAGSLIAYTQDWHPGSTPHFEKDGGTWPVHCVMNTWGAEFHPKLDVEGEVIQKGSEGEDGYSGFSVRDPATGSEERTRLEGLLRDRGIERVVVLGLATDYCVKETAIDAAKAGFETRVLSDGIRAVNLEEGDDQRALQEMVEAGARVE